VLAAGNTASERSAEALEKLCRAYWYPVYAFVRRRGHSPHAAQDFTQAFFARLLEKNYLGAADAMKGRFRTFLLTAVTRFLANEYDRAQAEKRGGGVTILSLDEELPEERYQREPADDLSPDRLYEQEWAQTLLARVLSRLREEFDGAGRKGRFDELKVFLLEDKGAVSYAEMAARLGVSESAVKSGIWRLRQRYGELVREEIAQTVTSESEVEEEIRHLLGVLAG
jgi:RNA polymerase sigma-70 factor (ECF subfamily)